MFRIGEPKTANIGNQLFERTISFEASRQKFQMLKLHFEEPKTSKFSAHRLRKAGGFLKITICSVDNML